MESMRMDQIAPLLEALASGKITLSQNNKEAVVVNVSPNKIDVDAKDKDFVKDMISTVRRKGGSKSGLSLGSDSLKGVRAIADELTREGKTVTISFQGDRILTVGAEADSKLTRLFTGTKGVQINNMLKLAELGL